MSRATTADLPGIDKLLSELNGKHDLLEDVQKYVQAGRDSLVEGATPISALVAKCANQVVGVVVLRDEQVRMEAVAVYSVDTPFYTMAIQ